MSITIRGLARAGSKGKLNEEWMLLANEGDKPFNLEGCSITVSRKQGRPRVHTTLKAGVVIQAGEVCRLVSGSSGKKSHGQAPEEEGVRNAYLFLKKIYIDRPGLTVRLTSRQHEISRAVFDPTTESGIASPSAK